MARLSPQMKHVAAAKWTGLVIGVLGFLAFTMVIGAGPGYLRWVIPLWYVTLGGIIGVAGWVDRIPLFNWPLPPLVRGAAFGAWMNLLGALFAWPEIAAALSAIPVLPAGLGHRGRNVRLPVWRHRGFRGLQRIGSGSGWPAALIGRQAGLVNGAQTAGRCAASPYHPPTASSKARPARNTSASR